MADNPRACRMCGKECGADGVVTECRSMPGQGGPSVMLRKLDEAIVILRASEVRLGQNSKDAITFLRRDLLPYVDGLERSNHGLRQQAALATAALQPQTCRRCGKAVQDWTPGVSVGVGDGLIVCPKCTRG